MYICGTFGSRVIETRLRLFSNLECELVCGVNLSSPGLPFRLLSLLLKLILLRHHLASSYPWNIIFHIFKISSFQHDSHRIKSGQNCLTKGPKNESKLSDRTYFDLIFAAIRTLVPPTAMGSLPTVGFATILALATALATAFTSFLEPLTGPSPSLLFFSLILV